MATDPARTASLEAGRKGPVSGPRRRRVELPEYLPARMLNEFVYCPRLFFYEWVEGVFAASADTIEGSLRHEKLEVKSDALPPPEAEGRIHSRSVTLTSDTHRLIAKMDLVEGEGGVVSPVDYKKGRPREGAEGPEAWPADRVQLCVQALILRDNGYRCDEAVAYYSATKQRVRVAVDDALVTETLSAVEAARSLAAAGEIPPPLVDSPKCPGCSLVTICLPDETVLCESAPPVPPDPQLRLFEDKDLSAVDRRALRTSGADHGRRLVPARDYLRPLYVNGHGLIVGKTGEVLQIRKRGETVQEVRVNEISQVNVFGNVQLTAPAIQGLCWTEKPLAHFTYGGWFYGLTAGLGLKNVFLRKSQFARAEDENFCLGVAREIVATKIRNQRTLVQRNHLEPPAAALRQLRHCADLASGTESIAELLGVEGTAARIYFECFPGMLKADEDAQAAALFAFDFRNRNRRPPRDPEKALLYIAYSLLTKDLTIVCHTIGFDPFIGFFHQPRFGRPALALDLMEGFRPLVADSTVLTAINTGMVRPDSFVRVGPAVSLSAAGRKAFLRAYEQRMARWSRIPCSAIVRTIGEC